MKIILLCFQETIRPRRSNIVLRFFLFAVQLFIMLYELTESYQQQVFIKILYEHIIILIRLKKDNIFCNGYIFVNTTTTLNTKGRIMNKLSPKFEKQNVNQGNLVSVNVEVAYKNCLQWRDNLLLPLYQHNFRAILILYLTLVKFNQELIQEPARKLYYVQ